MSAVCQICANGDINNWLENSSAEECSIYCALGINCKFVEVAEGEGAEGAHILHTEPTIPNYAHANGNCQLWPSGELNMDQWRMSYGY